MQADVAKENEDYAALLQELRCLGDVEGDLAAATVECQARLPLVQARRDAMQAHFEALEDEKQRKAALGMLATVTEVDEAARQLWHGTGKLCAQFRALDRVVESEHEIRVTSLTASRQAFYLYKEMERVAIQQTKLAGAFLRASLLLPASDGLRAAVAACEQAIRQLDQLRAQSDRTGALTSLRGCADGLLREVQQQEGALPEGTPGAVALGHALQAGGLACALWPAVGSQFLLVQLVASLMVDVEGRPTR